MGEDGVLVSPCCADRPAVGTADSFSAANSSSTCNKFNKNIVTSSMFSYFTGKSLPKTASAGPDFIQSPPLKTLTSKLSWTVT